MSWAEKYLGLPFRDGGREPKTGLDCWGLVCEVYRNELGIELPGFDDVYESCGDDQAQDKVAWGMRQWEVWKPVQDPEAFDLVAFWTDYVELPTHVGVMISAKQFLHVSQKRVMAPRLPGHPYWAERAMGFWRYAG